MRKTLFVALPALLLTMMLPIASHAGDDRWEHGRGHGGWNNYNNFRDNGGWHDRHNNHRRWQHGNDRIVYIAPPIYRAPVFYNPQPVFYRPQCNRPVYYAPRPTYRYGVSVFGR